MRLSKSTFIAWQRCPHTAWYRVNDRPLFESFVDPATRVLLAVGNEIDELARQVFPGGLLLGRGQAHETAQAIRRREPVIFQGEFVTDELVVLSDVLVWNADSGAYDIVEVKSSTSASTRHDAEYAVDLAFQEHVLKTCGVPVGKSYLMRLNSDYVRHGALDLDKLFARSDFSDAVAAARPGLGDLIADAHRWINIKTPPKGPCRCLHLSRGNHCEMFSHINPGVPDYSVHDIARISGGKLATLIDAGILEITDVPDDFPLSDKQATQVRLAKTGRPEIDRGSIAAFMTAIALPAAFLDFETHNPALPRFDGFRPYQQISFQFSLHVLERWNDAPRHCEFLHLEASEPDHLFMDASRAAMPSKGAVIVWNKTFECARLAEIASRHPKYQSFVDDVTARIVDLADVFSNGLYEHPAFRGSYSVKAVLPVVVPALSYDRLAIRDGAGAQTEWNNIVTGVHDTCKAVETAAALRACCKLDTLAMVEIAKVLRSL
jgi:hypothetical protein